MVNGLVLLLRHIYSFLQLKVGGSCAKSKSEQVEYRARSVVLWGSEERQKTLGSAQAKNIWQAE